MAWMGDIIGTLIAAMPEGTGSIMIFQCGHRQRSVLSPYAVLKSDRRKLVCAQCSKPHWDRLASLRENLTFDEVIAKLKAS